MYVKFIFIKNDSFKYSENMLMLLNTLLFNVLLYYKLYKPSIFNQSTLILFLNKKTSFTTLVKNKFECTI